MGWEVQECKECKYNKSIQSFGLSKSRVCNSCYMRMAISKHKDTGEETTRECTKCKKQKNIVTEYLRTEGGGIIGACNDCRKSSARRIIASKLKYKPRCKNSFRMDDSRWCVSCSTIKYHVLFSTSGTSCRTCRGLDEVPTVKLPIQHKLRNGKLQCNSCDKWRDVAKFHRCERMENNHGRSRKCTTCTNARKYKVARYRNSRKGKEGFIDYFNSIKEDIFEHNTEEKN